MSKIFLIYYRNTSSIYTEIFELTDDNIKYNRPWYTDYNPRRQEMYDGLKWCLTKRYGNQTVEDIPNLPLTRILDLARDKRYLYNNGFYYICEAENSLEAVRKFYFQAATDKEEEND